MMNYSPSSPEMSPHKQKLDTLSPLFDQIWDSTIQDTSCVPTQDLIKLAQKLVKVQTGNNDLEQPGEEESLLSNPLMDTKVTEKCKGKVKLSKAETWDILRQLLQDKSDSEMDNLKAFLSHEEIAMHLPESLPDVNDGDISNDDLDEGADSDETSSLMELQYTLQLLVPIPAPLLQPPVLTASPYDDVVGLCYIDHYLNGTLRKNMAIEYKIQQTLGQVIDEVAQLHLQVDKSFSLIKDKLDKLKLKSSRESQKLNMLHHDSDFMHSRVTHMQREVKTIKENSKLNTKVKRVVSFSDCCEVIPVSDKLPPVKTLSGLLLRAALHQQRGASYHDAVALSPLQSKRRGVLLHNAPALKANTLVVKPTAFEFDSDDDALEVLNNDDMEPYRISREGSWQHLPSQYAHPHSPASPYYKEPQDFASPKRETSMTPPQTPNSETNDDSDEPIKIQYILFILLLYFYNKLHNYCRSKLS